MQLIPRRKVITEMNDSHSGSKEILHSSNVINFYANYIGLHFVNFSSIGELTSPIHLQNTHKSLLTSWARPWICSISAGTLSMWIRNIVISFSVKPADTRGRRAKVNTAETETCFDGIFAFPSPRRSRDCNIQIKRTVQIPRITKSSCSTCWQFQYFML